MRRRVGKGGCQGADYGNARGREVTDTGLAAPCREGWRAGAAASPCGKEMRPFTFCTLAPPCAKGGGSAASCATVGVGSWEGWHQLRHRLGREKEGAEPVVPPQGRDERGLVLSPLPLGKGGGPAAGLTTVTDWRWMGVGGVGVRVC
ncbi:hypothetical protein PVAP13_2KG196400 [Panicum virgatum]|uniref:Uncharacterized protein n=1 Tax=Panicum virgatum TaxID=38727 RepID=A0A8T0W632_PANVG|nr:hypothetical protein PVAP13_2KG196400 [Panicum virgatum]